MGCTFQHQADKNPFVTYARKNGFDVGPLPPDENTRIWIGRGEASDEQYEAMEAQYERYKMALVRAGKRGRDISAANAFSKIAKTKYDQMVTHWIITNSEPEETSILDWWNGADGEDYFSPQGYGTIVKHFGAGLPVELETRVEEIDWSKSGVTVKTNKGTIAAKHCIVTVSNGVLANERIKITPELKKRQAVVQGIPMTNYMTIGMKFERRFVLPTDSNVWFYNVNADDNSSISWMGDVGGSGVVRANLYGNPARELEKLGIEASVDHAVNELKKTLGNFRVPKLLAATASQWGQDQDIMGSWSVSTPGFGSKRSRLRKDVAKRLHFAGEACHKNMYATCHGARLSGEDVAKKVARKFK